MDRTMNDPIEQRVKAIELKIQFLESWKHSPYIQITIPLIISLFLATSWVNVALAQMDKRIDSIDKRIDRIEIRMDRLENRMDKLESKMDKLLSEFAVIKSSLGKS